MPKALTDAALLMRLRTRQLLLLEALGRGGQLGRAAMELGMSHPAATKLLQQAEEAVGAALFTRLARGMQPTPTGEVLIRFARQALVDFRFAREQLAALRSGLRGRLRLGSVPGAAAIAATRSFTERYGDADETTSTLGITATSPTGCRSFSGSNLSFIRCGAIACPVVVASSSVLPSGVACAVTSAAMVFEAPGRFSTTTDWRRSGPSLSASMRARMSVPPPGEAPTMMRTALSGVPWAHACGATARAAMAAAKASAKRRSIVMDVSFAARVPAGALGAA